MSTANRFFPSTIQATVLTTSGMSFRYRRCCWNDTCRQRGRSAASPLEIPNVRPNLETYDVPYLLTQDDRMSEDLPFGSRGGIAIRHNFPLDGEYVIKIRLQRAGIEHDRQIIGLSEPHQLDVRLDGARIKLFTVGGEQPENNDSATGTSNPSGKKKFGYDYRSADTADAHWKFASQRRRVLGSLGSIS